MKQGKDDMPAVMVLPHQVEIGDKLLHGSGKLIEVVSIGVDRDEGCYTFWCTAPTRRGYVFRAAGTARVAIVPKVDSSQPS